MAAPSRKGRRKKKARRKKRPAGGWRRLLKPGLRFLLLIVLPTLLLSVVWIDHKVSTRFEERTTTFSSRVYAAPWTLRRGDRLDPARFEEELQQQGYRAVNREPRRAGEYQRDGQNWSLFLRESFTAAGRQEARPVEVEAWWSKVRRIRDLRTAGTLEAISLEPKPLFTFYQEHQEDRRWTKLAQIPPQLVQAVITVEDRRFRGHHGIDPTGIARALWADIRAGAVVQGGSTLTQQLVKNLLGTGSRSLPRKLIEAVGAVTLEWHEDKDAILEAYLNEVYLGQRGPVSISGVGEASSFYFGLGVSELDLPRCALLAGMIQNPGRHNPFVDPEQARRRRDLVLSLMKEQGQIDEAAMESARNAPLGVRRRQAGAQRFPWLQDYLGQEVRRVAPEAWPSRAGLSIFTTIDPEVQQAAEGALRDGLARVEARTGRDLSPPLEGALVVLRPEDGAILALVGGRDYGRSQFSRALESLRPPGSTFKPFVFLAAFERALVDRGFQFTAATVLDDSPLVLQSGGKEWSPANYDRIFRGPVTARQALEESINVPTVRAGLEVGPDAVMEMAERCGIESPLEPLPSLALGTKEVTPLELAGAYAAFANGGWRVRPHALAGAFDATGEPVGGLTSERVRVLDPGLAYLMTHLMEGVMQRGTGKSAARLGFTGHAAGKTGTSDDLRDAWFVGYTNRLLALVWVGYDDNRPVGLPGASAALPIWVDLMKRLGVEGDDEFLAPRGIETVAIDPTTGARAVRGCPEVAREIFLKGTEPEELCPAHSGKKRGFWQRLFGRKGNR
jgi:penicillin-binding protein 1B